LNEYLPGPSPKTTANKIIRHRLQYGIQKYQSWGKKITPVDGAVRFLLGEQRSRFVSVEQLSSWEAFN